MARAPLLITPLLLLLSLTVSVHALATCWYPDGVTPEPGHVPCNQTTSSASACCDPLDSCSMSGICLGRSGWTYRGSCTDQSWQSDNCAATQWPQCITDPSTKKKYSGWTAIWSCSSPGTNEKSFCCAQGDSTNTCCTDDFDLGVTGTSFKPGFDQFLANITQEIVNAKNSSQSTNTASAPTSSSTTTTSSSTSIAALPTSTASTSGNSDLGTKIGLGVGIPLGVLVAGILGLLFYRECGRGRGRNGGYGTAYSGGGSSMAPSPMIPNAVMAEQNGGYGGGYTQPTHTVPPPSATTQQSAYSPNMLKVNPYKPDTVYEAPPGNVHEMRG